MEAASTSETFLFYRTAPQSRRLRLESPPSRKPQISHWCKG